MDVSQYLEIFIDETKEHLQSLNEQLLILEKEPDNSETINEIFRAAHSLKGMAGTMGYKRMQRLTHDMENVFSEIRTGKMSVKAELVDVLFRGLDALESYLTNIVNSGNEGEEDYEDILSSLNRILKDGLTAQKEVQAENASVTKEADAPLTAASLNANKNDGEEKVKEAMKELSLADHEERAIAKMYEDGGNAYEITVTIQESCILKSARAYLVFKAFEEIGDVIKSNPEVQDIEDEQFDYDFTVVLLTKETAVKVEKLVLGISEIKDVIVHRIEPKKIVEDEAQSTRENNSKTGVSSSIKSNAPQRGTTATANQQTAKPVVNRSVRVDIEKLDDLMNLVSELIIAKNGLVSMNVNESKTRENTSFHEQIEYLERITTNLHQSVMKVRMVPIESVVNRFPRMIRDLSKKLGKSMELFMTGEDTELDRTVIDEIGDPLMHLLRNAADHGLESNEERIRLGKSEVGSIYLDAYQEGNNVVIEVRDDGAGIDVEKVKRSAINKGTITEEQATIMSDKEIIDLLFKPSFSTAQVISDVSGRGVGLDVVKTKM